MRVTLPMMRIPMVNLALPKLVSRERAAEFQGDATCRTCHMAGKCLPEDRCAVLVKVRGRYGQEEECLCWPTDPRKRAA